MADVFISYARTEQGIAARVAKSLQGLGYQVWWDAELPAHRSYTDVIEKNLEDSRAVLVLWSRTAAQSQWVRAEADFARNAGKLVQAQVDGSMPPLPFNQIQCADLKGWRGSTSHHGWAKISNSVEALVKGQEATCPEQIKGGIWRGLSPNRWWPSLALLLLVAVAGAILYLWTGVSDHKPVLAVLPFRTLDSHDEGLVAGIWEDTRQAIGRNPQLVVLGPNTVQQLAEKGDEAAKKAADYVLEASVRTVGDRVRVSADLVRTRDGRELWSQNFDRRLDDVFVLQSEIASEIEGRIRGRLATKGGMKPEHIATSGEAYALYSDARTKVRKRNSASATEAEAQLRQVLELDPNFAPAWALLANVSSMILPSQKHWDRSDHSEAYARKAIDLAPNLAAGHAALAFALKLKGPVASAEIKRAVELDPSDYESITWLGNMYNDAGDKKAALEAYGQAAAIEPYFWPAILNMYASLKALGDQKGIERLLEQERRVGADFLAVSIEADDAYNRGDIARAVNIGLAYWHTGKQEGREAIGVTLWTAMLQLGLNDAAAKSGPAPDFAPALWRNDPKGLDLMESHHIDARTLFTLDPLTENAGRVYLLSGRGPKFAELYRSLKISPEQFADLSDEEDADHFMFCAPLVAVALQQSGHIAEANALLSFAEAKAKERGASKPVDAVHLARIYAAEGRKDKAVPLLAAAVRRGWLPLPPVIQVDLYDDPPLSSLKGDPRFEEARKQILQTIARERALVDESLLRNLH